jgi:hypothetical protein
VLQQYLDAILSELVKCCAGKGGVGGIDAQCCASITAALQAMATAIGSVAIAISKGGAGGGGTPPDLGPVVQALDKLTTAVDFFDGIRNPLILYLERALIDGAGVDLQPIVDQLKRTGNRADRETADEDATIKALATLDAELDREWNALGSQG